jgi:transcription elongation factor GreA
MFLVTTHGETASDPDSGIDCLPHDSPLAKVALGMAPQESREVVLPAGKAILTIREIRNPTQAELDRLLSEIKPPQYDDEAE